MQLNESIKTMFSTIVHKALESSSNRVSAYQIKNYHWALSEKGSGGFELLAKQGKIRGKDSYSFRVVYSTMLAVGTVIELEAISVVYALEGIQRDYLSAFESLIVQKENETNFFLDPDNLVKMNRIEELLKKLSCNYQISRYAGTATACLEVFENEDRWNSLQVFGPRTPMYEIDSFLHCWKRKWRS